jgi:hypothetical protein
MAQPALTSGLISNACLLQQAARSISASLTFSPEGLLGTSLPFFPTLNGSCMAVSLSELFTIEAIAEFLAILGHHEGDGIQPSTASW